MAYLLVTSVSKNNDASLASDGTLTTKTGNIWFDGNGDSASSGFQEADTSQLRETMKRISVCIPSITEIGAQISERL